MKKTIVLFTILFSGIVLISNAQLTKADSLFNAGNYKVALKEYKSISKDLESLALQTNRMGFCYHKTGDLKNAVICYQKALELNTNPGLKSVIQSRLSRVYSVQKNNSESIKWLNLAVANGYQNMVELRNEKDFSSLYTNPRFLSIRDSIYKSQCPCVTDPRKNEFDFWIGEWTVVTTQGHSPAGTSKIEKVADNCLVLENWTAGNGTSGKSMNYIDPATGKWEQTWSGSGSEIIKFVNGVFDGKQMQFEFTRVTSGKNQVGKFHFFKISDKEVRQMEEVSEDNGTTWKINYDLTYIRNK